MCACISEGSAESKKTFFLVRRGHFLTSCVVQLELAGVAFGAVLAVLAGAVLAELAVGDADVVLVRALFELAAKTDALGKEGRPTDLSPFGGAQIDTFVWVGKRTP